MSNPVAATVSALLHAHGFNPRPENYGDNLDWGSRDESAFYASQDGDEVVVKSFCSDVFFGLGKKRQVLQSAGYTVANPVAGIDLNEQPLRVTAAP